MDNYFNKLDRIYYIVIGIWVFLMLAAVQHGTAQNNKYDFTAQSDSISFAGCDLHNPKLFAVDKKGKYTLIGHGITFAVDSGQAYQFRWVGENNCTVNVVNYNVKNLPIELLYFNPGSFETVKEINVWKFVIEYSSDNYNYREIQTIQPKGSGVYSYNTQKTGYYRLVEYDNDGYVKEFNPVHVEVEKTGRAITAIYDFSGKRLKEIPTEKPCIVVYADGSREKVLKLNR